MEYGKGTGVILCKAGLGLSSAGSAFDPHPLSFWTVGVRVQIRANRIPVSSVYGDLSVAQTQRDET